MSAMIDRTSCLTRHYRDSRMGSNGVHIESSEFGNADAACDYSRQSRMRCVL